jgi:diguanylate cyclase (GGDEF)-like protein/PAS domain S-box-containing protein
MTSWARTRIDGWLHDEPASGSVVRTIRAWAEHAPATLASGAAIKASTQAQLTSALFAVAAFTALANQVVMDLPAGTKVLGVMLCLVTLVMAVIIWRLPWQRWPISWQLWIIPLGFLLIAVRNVLLFNPPDYGLYFVGAFILIGTGHPRGTSIRLLPLLWIAYLLPLAFLSLDSVDMRLALSGAVTITILCLIVGETLAWLVASLRRVHEELATRRIGSRYRALVQNASDLVVVVDTDARILYVAPSMERMLGYRPMELLSHRLTELFVDGSAPEALGLLARLSRYPGANATQEWRVRHADGSTRVIEAAAVNLAEDPDIGGIVLTARDVTERHALEAQLSHEALHDPLTGLANRFLFHDRLTHAMARTRRRAEGVAMLFLDIDEFKDVNDTLGHQAGDLVLRTVAERISGVVRVSDTVARLGGDEFAVLIEDGVAAEPPTRLAERILAEVRRPISVRDTELVLGASVGVVLADTEAEDAEALVRDADIAMYAAKRSGKDRVAVFHPSMQARISERIQLVTELRRAIDGAELDVVYQPLIELSSDRMVGVEALVRWQHPERGLLLPGSFIGAAEESGLIVALGDHVLRAACAAAQGWTGQGSGPAIVSVNLSPRQFVDEGLLDNVTTTLAETGLAPRSLVLEITENVLIGDLPSTRAKLQALRAMGVRIAIDDFGMGYSSLNYLRALPVDILKIDRAFVTGLGTEDGADALVEAIVQMARVLGLDTIAEAIELPHEATRLRELGAHLGQGFHFARPMPAAVIGAAWSHGGRTADIAAAVGPPTLAEAGWA